MRRWLKAGALEDGVHPPSEEGTPQGGSISVLLSAEAIFTGRIEVGIAGGVEWLSGANPDTFREPSTGLSMGEHTETTRREWGDRPRRGTAHGTGDRRAGAPRKNRASARPVRSYEIHEAFSAQVLANAKAWEQGWKGAPTGPVDWNTVNVNGSSLAVGHPWSATGGRLLTTMAHEMARRDASLGLTSICDCRRNGRRIRRRAKLTQSTSYPRGVLILALSSRGHPP